MRYTLFAFRQMPIFIWWKHSSLLTQIKAISPSAPSFWFPSSFSDFFFLERPKLRSVGFMFIFMMAEGVFGWVAWLLNAIYFSLHNMIYVYFERLLGCVYIYDCRKEILTIYGALMCGICVWLDVFFFKFTLLASFFWSDLRINFQFLAMIFFLFFAPAPAPRSFGHRSFMLSSISPLFYCYFCNTANFFWPYFFATNWVSEQPSS